MTKEKCEPQHGDRGNESCVPLFDETRSLPFRSATKGNEDVQTGPNSQFPNNNNNRQSAITTWICTVPPGFPIYQLVVYHLSYHTITRPEQLITLDGRMNGMITIFSPSTLYCKKDNKCCRDVMERNSTLVLFVLVPFVLHHPCTCLEPPVSCLDLRHDEWQID